MYLWYTHDEPWRCDTHALCFDNKPDYSYLCKLFCDLFICEGYQYDYFPDWSRHLVVVLVPVAEMENQGMSQICWPREWKAHQVTHPSSTWTLALHFSPITYRILHFHTYFLI
jgi:hypothetical protein